MRLLRATRVPQRWPVCRGDARGFGLHPDVIQSLFDVGTEGDERANAHLATAVGAPQREHFIYVKLAASLSRISVVRYHYDSNTYTTSSAINSATVCLRRINRAWPLLSTSTSGISGRVL